MKSVEVVKKDNKVKVILSFFDPLVSKQIVLNDEDFRLIRENGTKYIEEFIETFLKQEMYDNYDYIIKSAFCSKRTSNDNVVSIIPVTYAFRFNLTCRKVLEFHLNNTFHGIENVKIPIDIIYELSQQLIKGLEEVGISVEQKITELEGK